MNRRHITLIASYSARYSVRGGIGLVFLLLSLTFGLLVAHIMLQPVELGMRIIHERGHAGSPEEVQKEVLARITEVAKPVVSWMLSQKTLSELGDPDRDADRWASYMLEERPALLSAIFLILLFGWPFIVSFGAFDLYASDISSRQLRYQLLRADRGSIFFGRLLGMLVTFVAVLVLLGVTVTAYMGLKLPAMYSWGALIPWALYGTGAMICVSLPYIALCGWISSAIGAPFASLTVNSLIIGGVPLLATLGKMTHEYAGYLLYTLPWGFQTRLFHHEPAQVGLAVAGCMLLTALFTWLGYRNFTTRDL